MRRALIVLALLCGILLALPARAQSAEQLLGGLDIDSLVTWADEAEADMDVPALIQALVRGEADWDLNAAGEHLKSLAMNELRSALRTLVLLALPLLIWAALTAIGTSGGAASAAGFVCSLTIAVTLVTLFERLMPIAQQALSGMAALTDRLYPMLAALLAASGKAAGAAMFSPAAAMAGGLIAGVIARWAMPLTGCAAALTVAGHLSERMRLSGLNSLVHKGVTWGLSGLLTLFTAMLSAQGLLAKSYDGASIQTARFAASSLIPVVGGELADSLDALVTSAGLVKNALGVTGVLLLVYACARPIVVIGMHMLAVRLAAALVEPVTGGPAHAMVEKFAGVISLLLAAVISGALLTIVMIGAALTVFGG